MSEDNIAAEWSCQQLILRFFQALDDKNYISVLDAFTSEGVWVRNGKELKGRDATLHALEKRSPTVYVHHVITNLLVESVSADKIKMRAYLLSFRHDSGIRLVEPAPLDGPNAVFILIGEFSRTAQGWKISYLSNGKPTFQKTA